MVMSVRNEAVALMRRRVAAEVARYSINRQARDCAWGEGRQSHPESPVREARIVEQIEDATHDEFGACGGARIVCPRTNVSTMSIGAPQRRHRKHGAVRSTCSVCAFCAGASLSSARASARLAVRALLASKP